MKVLKYILIHLATLLIFIPSIAWGICQKGFDVCYLSFYMISAALQVTVPVYTALYARKHKIINQWINSAITYVQLFALNYLGFLPIATAFAKGQLSSVSHPKLIRLICILLIPTFIIGLTFALIYQIKNSRAKHQSDEL